MSFTVAAIDHVVLNFADVAATSRWYQRALGMRIETYGSGRTAVTFGDQKINLRPVGSNGWQTARTDAAGSLDICFVTTADLDGVAAHWADVGIAVHEGPVQRSGARGPMTSLYALDPDGNLVEVARYA